MEMVSKAEQADALQGIALIETLAMTLTVMAFGWIFAWLSGMGLAFDVFIINAVRLSVHLALRGLTLTHRFFSGDGPYRWSGPSARAFSSQEPFSRRLDFDRMLQCPVLEPRCVCWARTVLRVALAGNTLAQSLLHAVCIKGLVRKETQFIAYVVWPRSVIATPWFSSSLARTAVDLVSVRGSRDACLGGTEKLLIRF